MPDTSKAQSHANLSPALSDTEPSHRDSERLSGLVLLHFSLLLQLKQLSLVICRHWLCIQFYTKIHLYLKYRSNFAGFHESVFIASFQILTVLIPYPPKKRNSISSPEDITHENQVFSLSKWWGSEWIRQLCISRSLGSSFSVSVFVSHITTPVMETRPYKVITLSLFQVY